MGDEADRINDDGQAHDLIYGVMQESTVTEEECKECPWRKRNPLQLAKKLEGMVVVSKMLEQKISVLEGELKKQARELHDPGVKVSGGKEYGGDDFSDDDIPF